MKSNDEIRRLLREADPAESRELPPVDRARMRAAITRAAVGEPTHRRYFAALAVGAAVVVAAIAFVAFLPRDDHRTVVESPPAKEAPPEGRTTQIRFTGPEGTKILWFVETPDAKELGS